MIVDTSAILAVLLGEPDARHFENSIARVWPRRMSVAALLEAATVVESRGGPAAGQELEAFLGDSGSWDKERTVGEALVVNVEVVSD